jgi:hypothetical protein
MPKNLWGGMAMVVSKMQLKYRLINPIKLKIDDDKLNFQMARQIADKRADKLCSNAVMLSWYNGTTGESHPQQKKRRAGCPGWISYAKKQGGDMTIDINNEQYVFVYQSGSVMEK